MTDTTQTKTFIQYDSVNPDTIPASANTPDVGVAGYVAGSWPDFSQIVAKFPKARHKSITPTAEEDADILDIENGDAVPSQAPGWIKRQIARGVKKPGVYADASTMPTVLYYLDLAKIARDTYVVWVAHLHTAAPAYPFEQAADAVQWTFHADGPSINLDESIAIDNFWDLTQPSPPVKNPTHYDWFAGEKFLTLRWGRIIERNIVQKYDLLRKHPVDNAKALKKLEAQCLWLHQRVTKIAKKYPQKNGKPSWGVYHRGWRNQQLIARSNGQQIV